jgi:uncharacterized integral membrane protein
MNPPTVRTKNRRQTDRRVPMGFFSRLLQFVLDMHSAESSVSWTRWTSSIVIWIIMGIWALNCIFNEDLEIVFTFEDMPIGLAGVIATMIVGKVGQAVVDRKEKRDWRNRR